MAQEISLSLFERNVKLFNKKGLRRRYSSIPARITEYARLLPLGLTSKFVLECTIDKDSYESFSNLLKEEGYTLLGKNNTYFVKGIIDDYNANPAAYPRLKEAVENLEKDYKGLVENNGDYEEKEENDVQFFFYPYKEGIETLCDFIEAEKDKLLKYAKDNDVTLMLKVVGNTNLVNGFIGFNFFDADVKDEEVVIDYSSTLTVSANFKEPGTAISACYYLAGIASNEEDLTLVNTHIFAENLKYTEE